MNLNLLLHYPPLGGVPFDGTPREKLQTVHLSVTVIFVVLSSAGIVFAVICVIFNFIFREKK